MGAWVWGDKGELIKNVKEVEEWEEGFCHETGRDLEDHDDDANRERQAFTRYFFLPPKMVSFLLGLLCW